MQHQVLNQNLTVERVMRGYCLLFMSPSVNTVEKIFIPINDGNAHWFLLIISLSEEHLLHLDSDPGGATQAPRHALLMRMVSDVEFVIFCYIGMVCVI